MDIEPILASFGHRCKDVATAFCVSRPAVSRWVRNKKLPKARIAQWLDIESKIQSKQNQEISG